MLTPKELNDLLDLVENVRGKDYVPIECDKLHQLITQAIEQQRTIIRWYGFLRLMADRSSWRTKINDVLHAYLYGDEASPAVRAAADRYARLKEIHHDLDD